MAVMAKRWLDYLTLFFVSTAILLLAITPTSGGETPSAAPTVQECRGHIENALKEFIVHQGPEDITPISATVAASSEDSASGEAETHSTQSQSSESQSESGESKDESHEGAPGSKESGSSESGSSESGSSESKEDEDKVKSGDDDSHSKEDGKDNTSEEGDSKDTSEEGLTKEGKDDTSEEGDSKESKEDTSEEGVTKKSADDSSEEGNTKENKDDSKSDESSEEGDTKKDKDDSKSDESSEEGVTKGGEDDSSEESKESKGESSSEESKESKSESSSEEGTKEGKDDSSEEETKDSKDESSEESDSKSDESVEVGAAVRKGVEGGSESSEESGSKDDDSKESSEEHKEGKSDEDGKEKDSSEEEKAGDKDESDESSEEKAKADSESGESDESGEAKEHEGTDESESDEHEESEEEEEEVKREPIELRSRTHVDQILGLDDETMTSTIAAEKPVQITLRELKKMYESAVKPMEVLYKFKDISNRFVGDAEIFSKPMILFIGPWSSGKSSIINYLMDTEDTTAALKTGAEPQSNGFTVLMYGETEQTMDGIEIAADWTFSTLQKFGQGFMDKLQGLRLPNNLLRKVTIVDTPGIIENRKQLDRAYPFNDACQWFIDRADIIYIVFDPTKLDMGLEMEALFDQLKGRESQARIVLNKADTVSPQELMKVQSTLLWNLSPLLGSSEPPTIFVGSFRSHQFLPGSPTTLFLAQESALLQDLRQTIDGRVENKISFTRRHAVRVRNHAKMVDCYLNTYYNHKTFFSNKKKIADEIIENPQNYHIYEGLSTLTNISRYDLPDPDIYRDFFKVNPLYDFKLLASTCSYFKGCPLDKLDLAIAYELPELMGKYRKIVGFGMEGKR